MTRNQKYKQLGFTVVELLVVFFIMILLASIVVVNWNGQRSVRNLVIGQNELITNIRKVQSYAIASKNTPDGNSANFYVLEFRKRVNQYNIQAIDSSGNVTSPPIETVSFPSDVSISNLQLYSGASVASHDCVSVVFGVVYAKTYFVTSNNCSLNDLLDVVNDPVELAKLSNSNFRMTLDSGSTTQVRSIKVENQTGLVGPTVYNIGS